MFSTKLNGHAVMTYLDRQGMPQEQVSLKMAAAMLEPVPSSEGVTRLEFVTDVQLVLTPAGALALRVKKVAVDVLGTAAENAPGKWSVMELFMGEADELNTQAPEGP